MPPDIHWQECLKIYKNPPKAHRSDRSKRSDRCIPIRIVRHKTYILSASLGGFSLFAGFENAEKLSFAF